MKEEYDRPAAAPGALRLHLNERSDGCAPGALRAIRALTAADFAAYPDYDRAIAAAADYFELEPGEFVLTNGLDEGLHAAATLALRGRTDAEAIIIEPAFDMYEVVTQANAGRVVRLDPLPDFSPGIERVTSAITPRTRIVFVNTPMNPTGVEIAREAIFDLAFAAAGVLVLVDEAYAEFGTWSLFDDRARLASAPNLVVGRTFAKAYGLAGLRIGLVAGAKDVVAELKAIVPPYTLNAAATAALPAALADRQHVGQYVDEARQSREILYAACDRAGIGYWKSAANFVLLRAGDAAPRLLEAFAARGIAVRDRTAALGAGGCIRVTAGRVADTRRVAETIEETLCGAR
jgi:histidinol-phosphate aminotransferase